MPPFNFAHAVNVVVRALIPIFGVALLGWSGTKLLVVYFADTLASFYSVGMLASYATTIKSAEYQAWIKGGPTIGKRLRTGIGVALIPLPFILVVGFFFGILPLFVMLDIQQVPWREFLTDRDLYIAVGCQFAGALTLLMNELDWVGTMGNPQQLFQHRVALLAARWGAIVFVGFFLAVIIPLVIYGPLLILIYAAATIVLELAPARALDLLARWPGRAAPVAKSVATSAGARHPMRATPKVASIETKLDQLGREESHVKSDSPTVNSSGRSASSWALLALGVAFAGFGAIGLWGALVVAIDGVPAAARVIEHHKHAGGGRMVSTVAQVEVSVAGGRTFRTEVDDVLGIKALIDGSTENVVCTKLATSEPHCELDSMLDRWLMPLAILGVGLGAIWWWWLRRK